MRKAIDSLPDDQREVFLLREEADLSFKEIADIVGISENTVKSRMRYALTKLRSLLEEYEDMARALSRSEQCKYDEQVLDYLYGELAEAERAEFANHLATCASCRLEIESLSGVRKQASSLAPSRADVRRCRQNASAAHGSGNRSDERSKTVSRWRQADCIPDGTCAAFYDASSDGTGHGGGGSAVLVVFKGKDQPAPVLDSPLPVAKIEAPAKLEPAAAPSPTGATPPATQVPVIAEIDGKPSVGKTASPAPERPGR